MNNLFSVLISSLKAKITPLWTKLRYWTSWTFIKSTVLSKIRQGLSGLFHVKPRDKRDYYTFLGWMVSRRLAHAIIIAVGLACLAYLIFVNPLYERLRGVGMGERVYAYSSIPLRFVKGDVQIKAKSGYIAYKGTVDKGYAEGVGELYDEYGKVVYRGGFSKSRYEGEGTLYYPSGQIKYEGAFQNNLFQGEGTLYRESGGKIYEGEFVASMREGEGILYDAAENPVFTGSFHGDELVYSQLLDKSASEVSAMYTGADVLFQGDLQSVRLLEDIDAFYVLDNDNHSLSGESRTDRIYVGKDYFVYGDGQITDIHALWEELGEPVFEGNSYVTFPEAVGIAWLKRRGAQIRTDVGLDVDQTFDEVYTVRSYRTDAVIYLYVFQKENITYTFMADERGSGFFMYMIEA